MTYREMKAALEVLTDEQLDQTIEYQEEDHCGMVVEVFIAEDDYINPSGEGAEPIGAYREMAIGEGFAETPEELEEDLAIEPIVFKKGTVFLITERPSPKEPHHAG